MCSNHTHAFPVDGLIALHTEMACDCGRLVMCWNDDEFIQNNLPVPPDFVRRLEVRIA